MNKVLVISFDLIRDGEPRESYAVSHIVDYAMQQLNYKIDYLIEHLTIDMNKTLSNSLDENLDMLMKEFSPKEYNIIAISAYVWNEYLLNPFISRIKKNGFNGIIALGGYQISYSNKEKLREYYPQADTFFVGYSEHSFHEFLSTKSNTEIYENKNGDFSCLSSPYLNNYIKIEEGQQRLRWETKRGCYYSCNFCAHKEFGSIGTKPSIHRHETEKVKDELNLFKKMKVKRINVLDPLFNIGNTYLNVMHLIADSNMDSEFTFQVRLENIPHKEVEFYRFMEYSKSINCTMEFGIQTLQEKEWKTIGRHNNLGLIMKNLSLFNNSNIKYEASLIYGLPHQTVSSFKESISRLKDMGCKKITAWPLMLLRGTKLFEDKDKYNLIEKSTGEFNIPTVVSSDSFGYDEWLEMKSIADSLSKNDRI
jgi:radical SAM superfamily enzyme YgiQ (UPF0313 family)